MVPFTTVCIKILDMFLFKLHDSNKFLRGAFFHWYHDAHLEIRRIKIHCCILRTLTSEQKTCAMFFSCSALADELLNDRDALKQKHKQIGLMIKWIVQSNYCTSVSIWKVSYLTSVIQNASAFFQFHSYTKEQQIWIRNVYRIIDVRVIFVLLFI